MNITKCNNGFRVNWVFNGREQEEVFEIDGSCSTGDENCMVKLLQFIRDYYISMGIHANHVTVPIDGG